MADDSECRSYGAEQGTPVYVQCRMVKDQQRIQQTAAAQAAANEQFNSSLCNLANAAYPGPAGQLLRNNEHASSCAPFAGGMRMVNHLSGQPSQLHVTRSFQGLSGSA